MKLSNKYLVSIIIPTKNAGLVFNKVLKSIFNQTIKDFEVIIIDSGSTDKTLDIAALYPVIIVKIKPEEFGHGKTRNHGVSIASGKFIVFLTHDAIPADIEWLNKLLEPFKNEKIAGVFGRQLPKENDDITDKFFYHSLYPDQNILWKRNQFTQGDNIFSSVNSAIRSELILKYPFPQNIIVSEDYKWAAEILDKNYHIFYSKEAAVIHSNCYGNLKYLFRRNFDIGISYKSIYKSKQAANLLNKGLMIHFNQIKFLIKNSYYRAVPKAILKDIIRFIAISIGKQEQIIPTIIKKSFLSDQGWYWI